MNAQTPKDMVPKEVILEFGRRQRAVKRTLLLALAAWGAVVVSIVAVSSGVASGWLPLPLAAVAVLVMVPYSRAGSRYRCPACGEQPTDPDGTSRAMVLNPPPNCRGCGVRLM